MDRIDPEAEARFWESIRVTGAFFMGTDPVHLALEKITHILDEMKLPYALVGAMALNHYGYRRTTVDVDLLVTDESLAAFKAAWLGRGYVEKFAGSRGVRDTENGVGIDFVIAGGYPGDGKPKPVRFPDPAAVALRAKDFAVVPVETLVELKLASGTAAHRVKDLGDVQELVKHAKLPRDLRVDPSVRAKYDELWLGAQIVDDE